MERDRAKAAKKAARLQAKVDKRTPGEAGDDSAAPETADDGTAASGETPAETPAEDTRTG